MHASSPTRPPALAGATAFVVFALLLAGPALGTAQAKRHRTCTPAHTKTLAATARVRVFESRKVLPETQTRATYGCLLKRKRPYKFYVPDFPTGYDHIAVAGQFVAYASRSDCAASFCDPNNVIVQNLKNGKVTFADGPSLRVASVSDVVLEANGSVAWITSIFDEFGAVLPGLEVAKAEHGQAAAVLAAGPDIVPGSLALAGSRLYWTQGATPRSALVN